MIDVRRSAERAGAAPFAVLIEGESGSGKELVAREIHRSGPRRDRPFCTLNCAALPDDLVESELFGHARGAFTGAVGERAGVFEEAHTGTLLLDEVGELSPRAQAKVLRVIQEGELRRIGENISRRIDVRIVSATNRDLRQEVAHGRFRLDLLYRLDVIRITVPPLRERREDIPVLASHFVAKYRDKYKSSVLELPRELLEGFKKFHWPGNIRQLENSVRRFLILPDLPMALSELRSEPEAVVVAGSPVAPPPTENQPLFLKEVGAHAAEQAEREVVLRMLDETNWNRKQAARLLNISYKALRNKLKKWNLQGRSRSAALAQPVS
jgi:two-component system response regulator AtoC